MKDWKPHHALWLLLQPVQEMDCLQNIYTPYGKVHLLCEPGHVIPCVHNLMEERFHLIKSEFPAGNMLRRELVNIY